MLFVYQGFQELFPEKEVPRMRLNYSGRFKSYNAQVTFRKQPEAELSFNVSNEWRHIDEDIQKGLIQFLLLRVFKEKKSTYNIELYNYFIKNLDKSIRKSDRDPELEKHFHDINESYFDGLLEITNLEWGSRSKRTLGTYNFHTDTIRMSTILREAPEHILKYVLYHEMCHKWAKFDAKNGRTRSHTSKFRQKESEFSNFEAIQKELTRFLAYK